MKPLHLSVITKPTHFNYPAGTVTFSALYWLHTSTWTPVTCISHGDETDTSK